MSILMPGATTAFGFREFENNVRPNVCHDSPVLRLLRPNAQKVHAVGMMLPWKHEQRRISSRHSEAVATQE